MEVWLVDGNPTNRPLASDTDFLSIALSPFALSGGKALDHFKVQKVSPDQLVKTSQAPDANPQIVVLADIGKLPEPSAAWLQQFVTEQGGSLVLFAGPKADDKVWDKQLLDKQGRSLLPMSWGKVQATAENQPGMKLDAANLTYPPLAAFARDAKGTLKTVDLFQWRELVPREGSEANVVMRLENGSPYLAIAPAGTGRVVQFASTANDRWTSLPRRLAFLPLMQQLFLHWSSSGATIVTPTSGQPLVFPLIESKEPAAAPEKSGQPASPANEPAADKKLAQESEQSPARAVVTDPNGVAHEVEIAADEVRFDTTSRAGLYRLDIAERDPIFAAVNVPDAELNRAAFEAPAQATAVKHLGATAYSTIEDYQAASEQQRFGRGIWTYLLLLLLIALVLEPLIQQRGLRWQS